MIPDAEIKEMAEKIATSRKYRNTGVPKETVEDILLQEAARLPKKAEVMRSARTILHNVMAPYLGDPDYASAHSRLDAIIPDSAKQQIESFCTEILSRHDSTRERSPYILETAPQPRIVLDLACGLAPFALPFMGLPDDVRYHAYDIHQPRVDLINHFLRAQGLEELAEMRDVLINPPDISADAAFLFKEAHRMEKRRKGCSRDLVKALKARTIFISLPNRSLDGQRDLHQRMDALFTQICSDVSGETGSREFAGETLYWIRKTDG
jgi:16S rRNA (guanine(1405)-N(7))-methyltransferase